MQQSNLSPNENTKVTCSQCCFKYSKTNKLLEKCIISYIPITYKLLIKVSRSKSLRTYFFAISRYSIRFLQMTCRKGIQNCERIKDYYIQHRIMTSSDNQVIYTPITHHLFPPFFNVVNKFRLFFSSQSA